MAVYWNLGLVTRSRWEADHCMDFFRSKRLIVGDLDVPLWVEFDDQFAIPDGFLVLVAPRGMSVGSPLGDDLRLVAPAMRRRIADIFDEWLVEAPPYAVAVFGYEAFDSFRDERGALAFSPMAVASQEGLAGYFVDEALWDALGRPEKAQPIGKGRFRWPRIAI